MKTLLLVSLLVGASVHAQNNVLTPIVPFDSKLIIRTNVEVYEGETMAPHNIMEREAEYKIVTRRITFNRDGNYTWYGTNDFDTGMMIKRRETRRGDKWVAIPK